ncbi:MAG: response regulator [Verrucomicrobia subdivision 3 bacterium]|nr:response regulator [Limisphaerales bacterium]
MHPKLTVLVAEDTPSDALFLERAFCKVGLTKPVEVLPDGSEVIAYLSGSGKYADRARFPLPTLLFTDLKMPRVNGFDLLIWLREHPQCAIPTVVFSDSGAVEDVKRAYQLGATAYLVKPGTVEELEDLVRLSCQFFANSVQAPVPGAAQRDEADLVSSL